MLIHLYEDENLVMVHRVDRHPKSEDFPWTVAHRYSIVYHISGDIIYYLGDNIYKPKSSDIMLFDFKEPRKMVINSFVPYERILIQFKKVAPKDSNIVFPSFSELGFGTVSYIQTKKGKNDSLIKPLNEIISLPGDYSAEIVNSLNVFFKELEKSVTTMSGLTNGELYFKIVNFLESDLSADLSLDNIAKKFNISRSKLNSLFRKRSYTTVWKYITKRRLEKARGMIQNGKKPTVAGLKCGFHDYSVFYRAYKSHFGISPKEDKNKNL